MPIKRGPSRIDHDLSDCPICKDHLISERGRALILAAAVLDDPDRDPNCDLAVLARQLTRAQEEIDQLSKKP